MFERNRSQNTIERTRVPVILTLSNGDEMSGHMPVAIGARLSEFLNGGQSFVEFEPRDGGDMVLNKQSIRSVAALNAPRADQLSRANDTGAFDPYAVLGVEKGASQEAMRVAYYALARAYHPDRFSGLDLPREMQAYANAMLARINLAYRQLAGAAARAA
jgi:hypothetical protein